MALSSTFLLEVETVTTTEKFKEVVSSLRGVVSQGGGSSPTGGSSPSGELCESAVDVSTRRG